jgi:hypothetical protein
MATMVGNYKVVRALLEGGASVDTADNRGETPLDRAYERYCYPEQNTALLCADLGDVPAVGRILDFINGNTAEILSLLAGYGTESIVFEWPSWHDTDPEYRKLDWVLEKLQKMQQERSGGESKARFEETMRIAERMKDSPPSEEVLQIAEEMRQSVAAKYKVEN